MITRRTFLAVGLAGGAALATTWWMRHRLLDTPEAPSGAPWSGLDPEAKTIVTAIVPAMLDGALPTAAAERASAIDQTVAGVGRTIAGLTPESQRELAQLFALLAFTPTRVALAEISSPWQDATAASIGAFLDRWRGSRWQLQRAAYGALHDLVMAAWYGNERSWAAIGYPGPPKLVR